MQPFGLQTFRKRLKRSGRRFNQSLNFPFAEPSYYYFCRRRAECTIGPREERNGHTAVRRVPHPEEKPVKINEPKPPARDQPRALFSLLNEATLAARTGSIVQASIYRTSCRDIDFRENVRGDRVAERASRGIAGREGRDGRAKSRGSRLVRSFLLLSRGKCAARTGNRLHFNGF